MVHSQKYTCAESIAINVHGCVEVFSPSFIYETFTHTYRVLTKERARGNRATRVGSHFERSGSLERADTKHREHSANGIKIKGVHGALLVVWWLGICLPIQGTRVRALAREDPTCLGATKPMRHNY